MRYDQACLLLPYLKVTDLQKCCDVLSVSKTKKGKGKYKTSLNREELIQRIRERVRTGEYPSLILQFQQFVFHLLDLKEIAQDEKQIQKLIQKAHLLEKEKQQQLLSSKEEHQAWWKKLSTLDSELSHLHHHLEQLQQHRSHGHFYKKYPSS